MSWIATVGDVPNATVQGLEAQNPLSVTPYAPRNQQTRRYITSIRILRPVARAAACGVVALFALLPELRAEDVNHVDSIRSVGANVEITLSSSRKFPGGSLRPNLVIGAQRFVLSRYPDDGNMKTLIFILTAIEFQALVNGSPMSVDHGVDDAVAYPSGNPWAPWSFGLLDKSLLQQ